ncbi:MAG: DNA sulfur modification protein DndB [Planctomycetes bacterium]|nr:DNA sulfur modification protein DndB [Planctomycetota bacterium]
MQYGYVFPAIRGIQAKREYFVSMCPLRLIPRIFLFDEEELSPEIRAQRVLNRSRIPDLSRYMLDNRDDYVFSAITASIDADVQFTSVAESGETSHIGTLHVPMDAKFIINDGQHRRAAIEIAIREDSAIGDESIAVVFFLDQGLSRCQQMFADLNRHAVRPSKSLGVLYDHRDDKAQFTRLVVLRSPLFRDIVEMERSTLSARSRKLFTLSAIYHALTELMEELHYRDITEASRVAIDFWDEVAKHIPEWLRVRDRKLTAGEVRQDFIHSHGIALHVLGGVGNTLLLRYPKSWKQRLKALRTVNWARSNTKVWEGRAMIGGRVSKSTQNVVLTRNVIKKALKLKLTPEEQRTEKAYRRGNNER